MIDDLMVVELLVRLNQSQHPPPPPSGEIKQLKWSVRQRRSRPATVKPATRASPTTPLSWSGGATSLSGGSGGRDESSHSPPKLFHHERSKVCSTKYIILYIFRYRLQYILHNLYRQPVTFPADGVFFATGASFWVFSPLESRVSSQWLRNLFIDGITLGNLLPRA